MSFNSMKPEVIVIDRETSVLNKEKKKVEEPPKWKVIMHNDNYTPMDFVIDILCQHFSRPIDEAVLAMLDVHEKGKGIAGVFGSRDIAETKIAMSLSEAKKSGYPFLMTLEKDD